MPLYLNENLWSPQKRICVRLWWRGRLAPTLWDISPVSSRSTVARINHDQYKNVSPAFTLLDSHLSFCSQKHKRFHLALPTCSRADVWNDCMAKISPPCRKNNWSRPVTGHISSQNPQEQTQDIRFHFAKCCVLLRRIFKNWILAAAGLVAKGRQILNLNM